MSLIIALFFDYASSLPMLKFPTNSKSSFSNLPPLESAACLFLGGESCNNRFPVDSSRQLDGNINVGNAGGLVLPILKPIFGDDGLDTYRGTGVDVGEPRVNSGKAADILGVYQTQQGIRDVGLRGQGNYGAAWGKYSSVLGDLVGYGDVNDVNFNAERLRLDSERRAGVRGLYEETYRTVVDPFELKFDRLKEICYGRILFGGKGICREENVGLAQST